MEALRAHLVDLGEKMQAILNVLGQLQGFLEMSLHSTAAAALAPA